MNYININKKKLVGRNNQVCTSPIVLDYSTVEEISFQFINSQNQIQSIEETSGLYFAGSLGIGQQSYDLLFLSQDFTISGDVLTFRVDTYTKNYLDKIKKKNTEINIEIGVISLETKKVILRDYASAYPRVYVAGLSPQEIDSAAYYTKTEVDELISSIEISGYATEEYVNNALGTKQNIIDADAKLDYALLSGTPTISDSIITLTQGGTTKGSFTLNQENSATIELDAGGDNETSSFITPSAYAEVQFQDYTLSSQFALSSNVSEDTAVLWLGTTGTISIVAGETKRFEVDLIKNASSNDETSFGPKDSVVFNGTLLGLDSAINYGNTYEKHIFTLYLNDQAVRQGVFHAKPRAYQTVDASGYYVSLDKCVTDSDEFVTIRQGDTIRMHFECIFKAASNYDVDVSKYYAKLSKLLFGATPIQLAYASDYNNAASSLVQTVVNSLYPSVYRLQQSYSMHHGNSQEIHIIENSFEMNEPFYTIGNNCTIIMHNNSCFAFKTSSNFSTYEVTFAGIIMYINAPLNLEADKCYIISYLNGTVVWTEMQEYESN